MRRALLTGMLLALAGCTQMDPYARPGIWQPSGVTTRNLAAMLADPNDLIRGRGADGANGKLATVAVQRLQAGSPKPLPNATTQSTEVAPSNSPGGGGGGGGGGAAPAGAP